MIQHRIITFNQLFPDLIHQKHSLQVDLHQSSSNTCGIHARGFINSLLQACLCQHSPPELMKPM